LGEGEQGIVLVYIDRKNTESENHPITPDAYLTARNLFGADLYRMNLKGVNFTEANLWVILQS